VTEDPWSGEDSPRRTTSGSPDPWPPLLVLLLERSQAYLRWSAAQFPIPLALAELHWLAVQAGAESPDPTMPAADPGTVARIRDVLLHRADYGLLPFRPPAEPGRSANGSGRAGYLLVTPIAIGLTAGGYTHADHHGRTRATLTSRELCAALSFGVSADPAAAEAEQRSRLREHALDGDAFRRLVERLVAAGLLVRNGAGAASPPGGDQPTGPRTADRGRPTRVEVRQQPARRDPAAPDRPEGPRRTRVVPVLGEGAPPLALGLMLANAQIHDGGRLTERYEFVPDWGDTVMPALTGDEPPAIYVFSNYLWTHAWNVRRSAEAKARSPHSITIHGGPNTPKHEADRQAYFDSEPHVDVCVHGEGERTFVEILEALRDQFDDGPPDLSVLADVPGLSFRHRGRVVHTGPRDRITDLDSLASPYLMGLFDSMSDTRPQRLTGVAGPRSARRLEIVEGAAEIGGMTIETNRGCPYGCTFCDWGSATLSRIRKFDLERVFAELEWCAQHKVKMLFCADSNFGLFERDVEIARKVAHLRQEFGYPKIFESSYAKNTVRHLREIIETLARGGIISTGVLALQSADPQTLGAIRRANITPQKYDALAVEFGRQGLPLVVEMMMGLPGSTMSSFLGDLQQAIDREVKARVNPTELLMNSPMNDPAYREEHRIETLRPPHLDWTAPDAAKRGALIVSTSTYTRDEYDAMERYRRVFMLCENYGALRQVARFVRQEIGLTETAFYVGLTDEARRHPGRWPAVSFAFETVVERMIPPVSWQFFVDEVHDYLTAALGVADGSALSTVLRVQHALLPAGDRTFPYVIALDHDFAAWHATMTELKRGGARTDWPARLPRLESYGPAEFRVDDPQDICSLSIGMPMLDEPDSDWELGSPVARPMRFRTPIGV
jgi:radical SAM superfamily enzyme YgiQ (UPF0313 family)